MSTDTKKSASKSKAPRARRTRKAVEAATPKATYTPKDHFKAMAGDDGAALADMLGISGNQRWLAVRVFKDGHSDTFTFPAGQPEDALVMVMTDDLSKSEDLARIEIYDENDDCEAQHVLVFGLRSKDGSLDERVTKFGKKVLAAAAAQPSDDTSDGDLGGLDPALLGILGGGAALGMLGDDDEADDYGFIDDLGDEDLDNDA